MEKHLSQVMGNVKGLNTPTEHRFIRNVRPRPDRMVLGPLKDQNPQTVTSLSLPLQQNHVLDRDDTHTGNLTQSLLATASVQRGSETQLMLRCVRSDLLSESGVRTAQLWD